MSEQTRNDLTTAANYYRQLNNPHHRALADRLDGLAATIDLRDAVIDAAEKWDESLTCWPRVSVAHTQEGLRAALRAMRAGRQAGTS